MKVLFNYNKINYFQLYNKVCQNPFSLKKMFNNSNNNSSLNSKMINKNRFKIHKMKPIKKDNKILNSLTNQFLAVLIYLN